MNRNFLNSSIFSSALTVAPQFTDAQLTFSTTTRLMPTDYEKENDEGFIPRPVVRKSLAPQKKTLTKQEEIGKFISCLTTFSSLFQNTTRTRSSRH